MTSRRPPLSAIIAAVVAVLCAALFVRLGMWQLDRLAQRRAHNAAVRQQIGLSPTTPVDSLPIYRRVSLAGSWDFAHQFIVAGRSYNGSPGVDIVTPLRLGVGRSLLVDRGWVYSADAASIDLTKWDEPDPVALVGYVERFDERTPRAHPLGERAFSTLDPRAMLLRLPNPTDFPDYYVVALPGADSASTAHPRRRALPALDEGPHKGYAIQWFTFAVIAIGGGGMLLLQDERKRRSRARLKLEK